MYKNMHSMNRTSTLMLLAMSGLGLTNAGFYSMTSETESGHQKLRRQTQRALTTEKAVGNPSRHNSITKKTALSASEPEIKTIDRLVQVGEVAAAKNGISQPNDELSFIVLMEEFGFSTDIASVTRGSVFSFSGPAVPEPNKEPIGEVSGKCTVVSVERLNDMICEAYMRVNTKRSYGHGVLSAVGMVDEIGGHLVVTATERDLSSFSGGKLTLMFQPPTEGAAVDGSVLYGLLKLS